MMTVSSIQPQSSTSLQGLRDAMEQAERQIVRLDRSNIQQFLVQMDQIEQMWTEHSDLGVLLAEEGRWQSLLKRIASNPQLLVNAAAQVGGLAKLRSQFPPATGPWWSADKRVADQRSQTWRRLSIIVGVVVLVVFTLWMFSNFISRGAATPEVMDPTQEIAQLVEMQNWQDALTIVKTARQSSPDDVNLLVWDAVLAQQLGNSERAQSSLEQAQEQFQGSPAAFWTLVGNYQLRADNLDGAEEAGQRAFVLAPKDAEITFLLGNVAEARGDLAQASEYFNQTITLAGDNNPQLVALVKIRMGYLMQSAGPLPSPAPKPDTTQAASP